VKAFGGFQSENYNIQSQTDMLLRSGPLSYSNLLYGNVSQKKKKTKAMEKA
jgi:hypothetical protein